MILAITGSPPTKGEGRTCLQQAGPQIETTPAQFSTNDATDVKSGLALHPLCELFPRLSGAELEDLAGDIKLHGLRQAITLLEGKILDGGNRYRACLRADIEPRFVEYEGDDPAAFVLSMNLHRRHLPVGQYAAIVSLAQDWSKAQPAFRPGKAGNVTGLSTVADRAAQSGASDKTQRNADKVAKASPELAKQVAHGEISLPQAVRQIEAKPTKAPAHVTADDPALHESDSIVMADLATELERINAENVQLREQLVAATHSDQAKELARLITERDQARAHADRLHVTLCEAKKDVMRNNKALADIRGFLGVELSSEIMDALRSLKGGAK